MNILDMMFSNKTHVVVDNYIEVILSIVDTEEEQDILDFSLIAKPWEKAINSVVSYGDYSSVIHYEAELDWMQEDLGNLLGYFDNYKKGLVVDPIKLSGEYTLILQLKPTFVPPMRTFFGEPNDDGGEIEYTPIQYYVVNESNNIVMGGKYE